MAGLNTLLEEVEAQADEESARFRAGFFKTNAGSYGAGDQFLGLTVPQQRIIARKHVRLTPSELDQLLASQIHEHRFIAAAILVRQYQQAGPKAKPALVAFYIAHLDRMNNWDLVDTSAPYILGDSLKDADTSVLDTMAQSAHLWTRRAAIIATLALIKSGKIEPTLRVAEILLPDGHDLIHKAVGWALREVGRKDRTRMLSFLRTHYYRMPRTTLRYAIEHLPPDERKAALAGRFLDLE